MSKNKKQHAPLSVSAQQAVRGGDGLDPRAPGSIVNPTIRNES